jgi:N-acetyl-anhydromuramyl-L-alanine amidase AmpD
LPLDGAITPDLARGRASLPATRAFIGIEAENVGDGSDPWPDVQMEAYAKGVAAILCHIGASSIMAVGHKEYALPPGRKIDPSFNMVAFRQKVAAFMGKAVSP